MPTIISYQIKQPAPPAIYLSLEFKNTISQYQPYHLKQGINIKTMCPNYMLEFRNTKSH